MDERQMIYDWINEFISEYQNKADVETKWREPIIGVANAHDPLYHELKNNIIKTHVLPSDIVPGAESVIVIFVPFAKEIVMSNIDGEESSKEWDYAYIETNNLLKELSSYLYEKITKLGYKASNLPPTYNYDQENLTSDWSHRSSAFIAGIGKFGINNMLITEKGCCGRIGSVITDMKLKPTERVDEEYCLYKAKGICGKCVKQCVNDAFLVNDTTIEYNKWKCNEQIYDKIIPQYPIGTGDACGKCMCGVPCSFVNPINLEK